MNIEPKLQGIGRYIKRQNNHEHKSKLQAIGQIYNEAMNTHGGLNQA